MCPVSFEIGYSHHNAEQISVFSKYFCLKYKQANIIVDPADGATAISKDNRLSNDFIIANSQIYRGSHGTKNTNFFNGDLMDARITCWDPTKIQLEHSTDLHPLCKDLVAVESYEGNNGARIRWYFENC